MRSQYAAKVVEGLGVVAGISLGNVILALAIWLSGVACGVLLARRGL